MLQGVVGSHAYGLAGVESDVDRLGVYAAPTTSFHGLYPPMDRMATVVNTDPDIVHHEALTRSYTFAAHRSARHLHAALAEIRRVTLLDARLRQKRNEARSALAAAVRAGKSTSDARVVVTRELFDARKARREAEAERDAERERYTRLVGEVEAIAATIRPRTWSNPTGGALADVADRLRALAATAPQTAPAQPTLAERIAEDIRAELVCCNIYELDHGTERAGQTHAICFWGEAAARIAESHQQPDSEV